MAPGITFNNEISRMMYGFGDSHTPNPETVQLVETIVLKQLRTIVQEALKYSDGKKLNGKELVFLMRHNKQKMRRFVKYLHNKSLKNYVRFIQSNPVSAVTHKAKKDPLLKFIETIDETGEFTDLSEVDEVKQERMLRADRISQALDEKNYLEFCKARRTSFCNKDIMHGKYNVLKLWIDPENEVYFEEGALDVLSYFAYQTVAEIIDYALLVRMDAKSGTDPLNHLQGSYYNSCMFNGDFRNSENKQDYSKVYSGQPPISVNEIKEVMRRVHSPQAGLLNFGGKIPETHYLFAL